MTLMLSRPSALRQTFETAQSFAERLAGPAEPWQPRGQRDGHGHRSRLALTAAAGALACLVAGGVLWTVQPATPHGPAAGESAPAQADQPHQLHPAVAAVASVNLSSEGAGPRPAPARVALPSTDSVTRQGTTITFDLAAVSLHRAVTLLAATTGSTVHGADLLASRTAPVTLRAQAAGTAEAWRRLLGDEVNTALACSAAACQVWIVGPMWPAPARSAPAQHAGGTLLVGGAGSVATPVQAPVEPASTITAQPTESTPEPAASTAGEDAN